MRTFTDSDGREWEINITLQTENEIHQECDAYLSDLNPENNVLEDLNNDAVLFSKVIAVLCRRQLTARDISSIDLLESLSGKPLDDAREAVIEATFDFLGRRGDELRAMRIERDRIDNEIKESGLKNLREMTGEDMAAAMLSSREVELALEKIIATDGQSEEDSESTQEDLLSVS